MSLPPLIPVFPLVQHLCLVPSYPVAGWLFELKHGESFLAKVVSFFPEATAARTTSPNPALLIYPEPKEDCVDCVIM